MNYIQWILTSQFTQWPKIIRINPEDLERMFSANFLHIRLMQYSGSMEGKTCWCNGASWVNIDIRLKRASVQIRRLTRRLVVRIFLVLSCNITLSQWENIQRHPHHHHREDVWFHQSAHEMFPSLPEYHIAILVNIPMLMMILYGDDWWWFTCIQRRSLEWMLVEQMQFDRKLILCHSPLAGDWWLRRRGWRWWCLWWFKVEADVWLASSEAALKRCREIGDEGQ